MCRFNYLFVVSMVVSVKRLSLVNIEQVGQEERRSFRKSDIVLSDAKQTSPPPTLNTKSTSVAESRTFIGQYRKHWAIGAKVDLKHDGDWLSGTVIAANLSEACDVYDVKLGNGAVVLDVSSDNLCSPCVYCGPAYLLLCTSLCGIIFRV